MVTIRDGEESFGCVSLTSLVCRANPNVRHLYRMNMMRARDNKIGAPESIAVMVRISLLHLNSGLTMSSSANWLRSALGR